MFQGLNAVEKFAVESFYIHFWQIRNPNLREMKSCGYVSVSVCMYEEAVLGSEENKTKNAMLSRCTIIIYAIGLSSLKFWQG